MQDVLADIQDGTFAKRFIADQDAGAPSSRRCARRASQHPIEATGRELRKLMAGSRPTTTTTSRAPPPADADRRRRHDAPAASGSCLPIASGTRRVAVSASRRVSRSAIAARS